MALRSLAGQAVVELLLRDRMTQGLHKAGAKLSPPLLPARRFCRSKSR